MFYIGGENVRDRGRKCSAAGPHFWQDHPTLQKKAGYYYPAVRIFFTSFTSASISSNRSAYRVIVPIACLFTS